ncbi:MAG: right-handed parallel beta-helix repeat-containing protein [Bacteroidetes bacterium]|nr:right-handed parallel beta-helix repeat-containing protein [Bacteroidota bacterium]
MKKHQFNERAILRKCGILIFLALFTISCSNEINYYVSPDGNDENIGTQSKPFATIDRAIVETGKVTANNKAVNIYLREGIFQLKETLEFNEQITGYKDYPITIQAYGKEKVSITGGPYFPVSVLEPVNEKEILKRILSSEARKKIRKLNLKKLEIADYGTIKHTGFSRAIRPAGLELFFNDKAMQLAAYPADRYIKIEKVIDKGSKPRDDDFSDRGGVFTYDVSRPSLWCKPSNLWVQGMFGTVWADDKLKVADIDTLKKQITTEKPHLYGITGGHFRFINILDEIKNPGDYFVDYENGVVYLIPYSDEKSDRIFVSLMEEPLVVLEGANYIIFKSICFENSRGMGAYLECGEENIFINCTFRNFGTYAISIGKGIASFDTIRHEKTGKPVSRRIGSLKQHQYADPTYNRQGGNKNGLISCTIYNTGAGGVSLGGGDIKTLTPAGNFVENCNIYKTNRRYQTYAPCIDLSGVGNKIINNKLHDATHSAIIFYGNDHLIEGNEIYRVLLESDDGGGIYTGRDVTTYGTVIRNNFFYKIGSPNPLYHHGYWHGIYLDDFPGGIVVENNVFYDILAGILVSGRDVICNNNIFINCDRPVIIQTRPPSETHKKRLLNINPKEGIWKERFPSLSDALENNWGKFVGTTATNNISVGTEKPCVIIDRVDSTFLTVRDNFDFKDDEIQKLFVDPDNMDFTLKKDALIFQLDSVFKPIDFSRFRK